MNTFHGVVSLLKPPGMTSHDAVAHVRRVLKTKRVGHTGTLDPAASGVLPICVGQATRLVEALQAGTKEYLAEATFGYQTDTLDAVGQTVRECDATSVTRQRLEQVLLQFRGVTQQQPPMYSAIKVDGRKLYEIARVVADTGKSADEDKAVEIPTRSVEISALEITRFDAANSRHSRPRAFMRIECSGGTYIRSLVRDIGQALDNAATMTFLTRQRSGRWALGETVTPQEFERHPVLVPLPQVLERLYGPALIDDEGTLALWQGRHYTRKIAEPRPKYSIGTQQSLVLWSNGAKTLFALASAGEQWQWKPIKVFDLRVSP